MRSIRRPARSSSRRPSTTPTTLCGPGQYVNARVLVRTDRDALTIPTSAVQLGPNGPFTYVVKSGLHGGGAAAEDRRAKRRGDRRHGRACAQRACGDQQSIPAAAGTRVRSPSPPRPLQPRPRRNPTHHERIMSISEPFVRRPIATSLLMGGIFLVGLVVFPAASRGAAAPGRLPDHPGHGESARRQPRDHGFVGRDAAGVSVRRDLRACRR